jgi:ABC-2 type transport system ATP-binding protein
MSGLDPIGRREVRDLIASLRTTGTTVFLCSHILSDIEVLCDRVAILKRGRLVEQGRLEDLRARSGEEQRIEITVTGTDAEAIEQHLKLPGASVLKTAAGARIEVANESDVDEAIKALRSAGGRLVSVQPVRQSLEELFMREAAND